MPGNLCAAHPYLIQYDLLLLPCELVFMPACPCQREDGPQADENLIDLTDYAL